MTQSLEPPRDRSEPSPVSHLGPSYPFSRPIRTLLLPARTTR
jgi:hypothetical protein